MGSTPLLLSEGDCLPHGTKEEYSTPVRHLREHTIDIGEHTRYRRPGPNGSAIRWSSAPVLGNLTNVVLPLELKTTKVIQKCQIPVSVCRGDQGTAGILIAPASYLHIPHSFGRAACTVGDQARAHAQPVDV